MTEEKNLTSVHLHRALDGDNVSLGWIVTRIANLIANTYLRPAGDIEVDLFYFPVWLVAGAILFSILISLAAGLYPAARAARIDPVEALRHD